MAVQRNQWFQQYNHEVSRPPTAFWCNYVTNRDGGVNSLFVEVLEV